MYKARVLNQLVCDECQRQLIIKFNEAKKDFYYVCPMNNASLGDVCKQSGFKFKIPVITLDLELYED